MPPDAGSAPPSRGLEYSLDDLKTTLHLNSLDHAVELCEAVGLDIAAGVDNIHFAMIPRASSTIFPYSKTSSCRFLKVFSSTTDLPQSHLWHGSCSSTMPSPIVVMQGFKATSDDIPRRRSHAISAKAQPLRSQVAQSIVPDPQAAAHAQVLAQQQMERLQAWRTQQVRNSTPCMPSLLIFPQHMCWGECGVG